MHHSSSLLAWTILLFSLLTLASPVESASLAGYGTTVYPWVMIVIVLIAIGLVTVVIIESIIIYKVIKLGGVPWRSIWLGQTLLFGVVLSYLALIPFIFQPTTVSCDVIRFGVGVSYALMLAVLFVKVLIVLSPKIEAGFLKFGHQILILMLLWVIQIIINATWLILSPSVIDNIMQEVIIDTGVTQRSEKVPASYCKPIKFDRLFFDFLASFVFIMILLLIVLATTLVAYTRSKRKSGKADSESRWVLVTTILTAIVWLIWMLVGSFLPHADMASLAIGLWATATVTLLVMFIPKLHKLATLKDGEFYYEDEIPGMGGYNNEGIELDPDPEHNSVIAPPSYQAESVLYAPSEVDGPSRVHNGIPPERAASWNDLSSIPQYPKYNGADRLPPSVILEEKSNLSSTGRSPSIILKQDINDKPRFQPDPNALELHHPVSRPSEQYFNSGYSDYGPPTQRYYTIGGHGRRHSASLINAPRYERRFIPVNNPHLYLPSHEPQYIEELRPSHRYYTDNTQSSVSMYSLPRSYHHRPPNSYLSNGSVILDSSSPNTTGSRKVHKAASVVGAPRYEPKVMMNANPTDVYRVSAPPRRTHSYTDISGAAVLSLPPRENGSTYMTGSLPRPTKVLYKQTPNGKFIPVEQRPRAFNDDMLERRSVY